MAYSTKPPFITKEKGHGNSDRERHEHPAFGKIVVSRPVGGGTELFGSSMRHNSYISFQISGAVLDRELNNDWIHGRGVVAEFMMSEAQFVHFVSSAGNGEGTPITFRYRPEEGSKLMDVPGIRSVETKQETFRREVEEDCRKALESANALVSELRELVAAGKANKGQLSSALSKLEIFTTRLPSHLGFVQESFARGMEKTVEAGKSEIHAYTTSAIMRAGLDAISSGKALELSYAKGDSDAG